MCLYVGWHGEHGCNLEKLVTGGQEVALSLYREWQGWRWAGASTRMDSWACERPWMFPGMSSGVILVNSAWGALLVFKGGPELLGTSCTWCPCCTDPAGGTRRQASQLRGSGLLGPWLSLGRVLPHHSAGPGFPLRNFLSHCMCLADRPPHLSPAHCILLPVTHSMWLPLTGSTSKPNSDSKDHCFR